MKIRVISVGKKHDKAIAGAIDEYATRLGRVYALEWEFMNPSGFDEVSARRDETERILSRLTHIETIWLLDERGKQITSPELSSKLEDLKNASVTQLTIIIGGAYGVDESLRQRAQFNWSLSTLVFPHQIVRLLLAEQLYRATEINRGSGYHHQ